jgi:hypothetical protein
MPAFVSGWTAATSFCFCLRLKAIAALMMLSAVSKKSRASLQKCKLRAKFVKGAKTVTVEQRQAEQQALITTRMMADTPQQSSTIDSSNPLLNPSILQNVLSYVGRGHHLFVALVGELWQTVYASLKCRQLTVHHKGRKIRVRPVPHTTFYSSAFASPSRVKLAAEGGLDCTCPNCQRAAGKHANISTLATAHELGMDLTEAVMSAAVECNKLAEVQYLHSQGCDWPSGLLEAAAGRGYFELLRWCYEHGCPWNTVAAATLYAAKSGNVELMAWVLQQSGTRLSEAAMGVAALKGHTALCKYLYAQQCPWSAIVTKYAALRENVDLLRWLIDSGCPWDAQPLCQAAAQGGSVAVLTYLQQQGILSAVALANLLNEAACGNKLAAVKWLRAQGAEWPVGGVHTWWHIEVLEWARSEGFTH